MQVDQNPFPMHAHVLKLKNPKILIWPSQAESTLFDLLTQLYEQKKDFDQFASQEQPIVLHLWPIVFVYKEHCNHW